MTLKSSYPILPSTIGYPVHTKDPSGTSTEWVVIDEVRRNEGKEKVLLLQRLQRKDPDQVMIRFGYYIIGKRPKMMGKWTWGQFAPFIAAEDFSAMIKEAVDRKWLDIS